MMSLQLLDQILKAVRHGSNHGVKIESLRLAHSDLNELVGAGLRVQEIGIPTVAYTDGDVSAVLGQRENHPVIIELSDMPYIASQEPRWSEGPRIRLDR